MNPLFGPVLKTASPIIKPNLGLMSSTVVANACGGELKIQPGIKKKKELRFVFDQKNGKQWGQRGIGYSDTCRPIQYANGH
jgi:hypothetical protein